MVIEPLLSLAGTIDPSAQKTLTVTFYAEGDTSIRQVPDAGQLILAVMKWNNFIVSDFCLFMPNQCALTTIRDLNDPDVVLTIKNLQDARAHSDPNPYHPTTKPAEEPRK